MSQVYSDGHQGLPYGPNSVRTTHQAWSKILTKTVQTTSGKGLNFSQNLFGLPSEFVTYNRGSYIIIGSEQALLRADTALIFIGREVMVHKSECSAW